MIDNDTADGFCAVCGEPLEVVEMLDFNLSDVDEDSLCDFCLSMRASAMRGA